jgi:hypothetical protein
MMIRLAIVGAVACLGLNLPYEPECAALPPSVPARAFADAKTALGLVDSPTESEPATACSVGPCRHALGEDKERPIYHSLGVAGTSTAWPYLLSDAIRGLERPSGTIRELEELTEESPLEWKADAARAAPLAIETSIELLDETAMATTQQDLQFSKIVAEMAARFREVWDTVAVSPVPGDAPKPHSEEGVTSPDTALHVEGAGIAGDADVEEGLAFELNRAHDGINDEPAIAEAEPAPPEAVSTMVEESPAMEPIPAPVEEPQQAASRSGRLSTALRLTGQAFQAWADVLDGNSGPAVSRGLSENSAVR